MKDQIKSIVLKLYQPMYNIKQLINKTLNIY